jgi:hypothetical protein
MQDVKFIILACRATSKYIKNNPENQQQQQVKHFARVMKKTL